MKIIFIIKILTIWLFLISNVIAAQSKYFEEGIKLYENKKFNESKILFERDIVFNPKNERSYLYLAKIFNEKEDEVEQEINLNNVLLLNPQNDEALYMLTLLKIKQSNYSEAKELIDNFVLVCRNFCSKKDEIKNKLKKLVPENEKNIDQ